MNLSDVIKTRRSVRKFAPESVTDELIDKLLSAAMLAPSAGNQQPWHFAVITDPDMKKKMHIFASVDEADIGQSGVGPHRLGAHAVGTTGGRLAGQEPGRLGKGRRRQDRARQVCGAD